jgi:hypothetical protein
MANIILLYNLKAGADPEAYETWQRTVDYPVMRGLKRVASFVNHRGERLLLGGFLAEDMGGPVVQIMGEFTAYVESPEFLVAQPVV